MSEKTIYKLIGVFNDVHRSLMPYWYDGHGGHYQGLIEAQNAISICRDMDPNREFYILKVTTKIERLDF